MNDKVATAPVARVFSYTGSALTLMAEKLVSEQIDLFAKAEREGDNNVHRLAVQSLMHAETTGDANLALRLIQSMGARGRPDALRKWFGTFSPVKFTVEDGVTTGVSLRKARDKNYRPWNAPKADETTFWALNPEVQAPMTLAQKIGMVMGLAKQLESAKEEREGKKPRGYFGDEKTYLDFADAVSKAAAPFKDKADAEAKALKDGTPKVAKKTARAPKKAAPKAAKLNGHKAPEGQQPNA